MRNFYIDRLRALAIFIVLLGHSLRYIGWWSFDVFPVWIRDQIVTSGYYGVTIFFVISGYLITSKFVDVSGDVMKADIREFYVQRIGRIIPPLCLLLVASAAIAIAGGARTSLGNVALALTYFLRLDFQSADALFPHPESSWDALWSLVVEEQFYVFLPVICLLLIRKTNLAAFLAVAVIVGIAYRIGTKDTYSFFGAFDQIAIGCLTAIYAPALRLYLGRRARWLRAASIVMVFWLYLFTIYTMQYYAITAVAACAATYIVGSAPVTERSALLMRWWEQFGAISYEVYLIHFMIFWAAATPLAWLHTVSPSTVSDWAAFGAVLAVIYATSFIIEKYFSRPLNRRIRTRFGGRCELAPATTPVHAAAVA